MQMISASFLACFPQALPKVPVKNPHPFVMGIECFSPFSATHPTPTSSPGVESDFSLQNSLRLIKCHTQEGTGERRERTGNVFVTKRLPAGGGGLQAGLAASQD